MVYPVALNGPILTIRRFPEHPITMEKLIELGSITQECAEFLQKLVNARYSMVIGGGTGSGKTTFLAALSEYIPRDERLITIEDNAELRIRGIENLVRLEAKMANMAGAPAVTIRDLIRSALRMRPDRIIVGEVRGGEAMDMLQALNTGHDGSLSTAHANSAEDMLSRLETMVLMGVELPLEAIRRADCIRRGYPGTSGAYAGQVQKGAGSNRSVRSLKTDRSGSGRCINGRREKGW